jgi:hypothetical protein
MKKTKVLATKGPSMKKQVASQKRKTMVEAKAAAKNKRPTRP